MRETNKKWGERPEGRSSRISTTYEPYAVGMQDKQEEKVWTLLPLDRPAKNFRTHGVVILVVFFFAAEPAVAGDIFFGDLVCFIIFVVSGLAVAAAAELALLALVFAVLMLTSVIGCFILTTDDSDFGVLIFCFGLFITVFAVVTVAVVVIVVSGDGDEELLPRLCFFLLFFIMVEIFEYDGTFHAVRSG